MTVENPVQGAIALPPARILPLPFITDRLPLLRPVILPIATAAAGLLMW